MDVLVRLCLTMRFGGKQCGQVHTLNNGRVPFCPPCGQTGEERSARIYIELSIAYSSRMAIISSSVYPVAVEIAKQPRHWHR